MSPIKSPIIISITSIAGGGKTALSHYISEKLPSSKCLNFDDFDYPTAPEDIDEWIEQGGNYTEWDIKPFVEQVNQAVEGSQYTHIILDYPFARSHPVLQEMIDYAFFIDTPLDIALARRILRDYKEKSGNDIIRYLEEYLMYSRPSYTAMAEREKLSADIIIDGNSPLSLIAENILKYIV
ncbi:hypothetical protein ACK6VY_11460 [Proteus mirabilis]|uniref:hypothetical protein n=1 Tax=Proteus mirabilis TaxID=584 RepID=UPI0039B6D35D